MEFIVKRFGNWLFLILFGLGWGFTFPLSKIAVSTGHQPAGLIFWQLVVSIVVLGAITFYRRLPLQTDVIGLLYCTGVILIGTLLPNMFSYWAFTELPAGIVAIAIATVPMFSLLIALLMRLERFEPLRMIGISLGVLALILIALPEAALPDPSKRWYLLIAIIAPLCYGMEGNFVARYAPSNVNPISSLFLASCIGLVAITPVVYWRGEFVNLAETLDTPELAMLGSGLCHTYAYVGYLWLIGRTGPVFTSQIAYFVTTWAVLISWYMLGEENSWLVWLSLVLMLLALRLVQPKPLANQ